MARTQELRPISIGIEAAGKRNETDSMARSGFRQIITEVRKPSDL